MPIVIQDLVLPDKEYVNIAFRIRQSDEGESYGEHLGVVAVSNFDTASNQGRWSASGYYLNLFAWSEQGTFRRLNHSLYFFSDDAAKPNRAVADFVLHNAPAAPNDYLANRGGVVGDGVGKITNPRNPFLAGKSIDWQRIDVQPDDGDE